MRSTKPENKTKIRANVISSIIEAVGIGKHEARKQNHQIMIHPEDQEKGSFSKVQLNPCRNLRDTKRSQRSQPKDKRAEEKVH